MENIMTYEIEFYDKQMNFIESFETTCVPYQIGQTIRLDKENNSGFETTHQIREFVVNEIKHNISIKKYRDETITKHTVIVILTKIT